MPLLLAVVPDVEPEEAVEVQTTCNSPLRASGSTRYLPLSLSVVFILPALKDRMDVSVEPLVVEARVVLPRAALAWFRIASRSCGLLMILVLIRDSIALYCFLSFINNVALMMSCC